MSRSLQAAEKIPWALKHNAVVDALFMAAFVSESLYIVYSCASGGGAPEVATLFVSAQSLKRGGPARGQWHIMRLYQSHSLRGL